MNRLETYLSFVRFSHSVFALPFALTGALLASRQQPIGWRQVLWIIVAMVAARSAAMGFNRLVDARFDALNPRTASRELPRGLMSKTEAMVFVIGASLVFGWASWQLSPLCGLLAALGWAAPLHKDGHDDASRVGTAALAAWQAPWQPPL